MIKNILPQGHISCIFIPKKSLKNLHIDKNTLNLHSFGIGYHHGNAIKEKTQRLV